MDVCPLDKSRFVYQFMQTFRGWHEILGVYRLTNYGLCPQYTVLWNTEPKQKQAMQDPVRTQTKILGPSQGRESEFLGPLLKGHLRESCFGVESYGTNISFPDR